MLLVFTVKVSFRVTLEDILTKGCHICLKVSFGSQIKLKPHPDWPL